jgi:hypothetical protein
MAGRVGFEPTTSSLEGWLAIRAATSAQQLERKIVIQVLRFPIGLSQEKSTTSYIMQNVIPTNYHLETCFTHKC